MRTAARQIVPLTVLSLASVAVVATIAVGNGGGSRSSPPAPVDPARALSDHTRLLDPIQVASLTVTPIVSTRDVADANVAAMTVLDEAMPKKLVTITEKGDVNNLVLTNNADQPLFVMSGEVIIGGRQDRIIGRNTIIPPKTTQDVPVFCVEHGRWTGNSSEFTTAKALAHGRLRGKASFASQQDVWDEVSVKNGQRKTESATGTYRQIAAQQSDGTLDVMQRQLDGALARLSAADRSKLVGFAVALNGKVASVDVFNSPALFDKLETKLLHSYLTEAVDVKADATVKAPTASDVKDFVKEVDAAPAAPSYATPAADTRVYAGKYAAKAEVQYKPAHAPPPAATPAAKKAADDAEDVYEGYQAK